MEYFFLVLSIGLLVFLVTCYLWYERRTILLAGILCNLFFLAMYYPIFGNAYSYYEVFSADVLKLQIGARSVLFSSILCISALVFSGYVRRGEKSDFHFLVLACLYLLCSFYVSDAVFMAKTTYVLNSFLPVFLTLFFILKLEKGASILRRQEISAIYAVVYFILLLVVVYSLVLSDFYDVFRPDIVASVRERDLLPLGYGLYPGPWWTQIESIEFIRLVGVFPDPIILGYFLAVMSVVFLVDKKYLAFSVCACLLLLSLSKGAWLFCFNTVFLVIVFKYFKRIYIPILLLLVVGQLIMAKYLNSSAAIHYYGLEGGLTSILSGVKTIFIGYGVGNGGNLASISAEGWERNSWLSSGSESGVGVLLFQLGFIGLGLVLLWLRKIYFISSGKYNHAYSGWSISLVFAFFINSFLQENCINSSLLGILLLGVMLITSLGYIKQGRVCA